VKSEPKAFASLSSGLLARKGAAKPAMRPQGFGQGASSLEDLGWNDMGFEPPRVVTPLRDEDHDAFGEELGEQPLRNPVAGLTPVHSPVHSQQAEIAGRLAPSNEDEDETDETAELFEPEDEAGAEAFEQPPMFVAPALVETAAPRRAPRPRAAPGSKGKAAFTLRLDPERHLKLRLACAVAGRSAQLMVTDALDVLLADMPELNAMAAKAKSKG
jgi:hypothetical protein